MAPGDINDTLVTPLPQAPHQPPATNAPPKTLADYLAAHPHLTDLDKRILALPSDAHFTPHTWPNLHALIRANDLHLLTRSPSQTRAYLDWTAGVRARYGGLTVYLLRERLGWEPLPSTSSTSGPTFAVQNPVPFADEADYAVLRNDWPYGLEAGIAHLCVWLKTPLAVREGEGDLTDGAREVVEGFVGRVFRGPVGEGERGERVLWFKNWVALQSVRGVDHVHVLVRDAPGELLREWQR